MYFSQRLKVVEEYRKWIVEARVNEGLPITEDFLENFLAFLETKGYLKEENAQSAREGKPRDMIELPCKEHFFCMRDDGHITENWRVFYRGEFALIETAIFPTEPEADAFLAKKKTEKDEEDLLFAELKEAEGKFYDAFNRLSYKKRTEGKFGDADVDELLMAYDRMCEIEKKRRMRK